ncbi:MAG: hypothetical protein ABC579_07225, partial [Candidatus Methanosuratincola petrocarbonis]
YWGFQLPKKGFSAITVPSDLYEKIRAHAENENLSIADYLKKVFDATFFKSCPEDRSVAGSNPASGTIVFHKMLNDITSKPCESEQPLGLMVQYQDPHLAWRSSRSSWL